MKNSIIISIICSSLAVAITLFFKQLNEEEAHPEVQDEIKIRIFEEFTKDNSIMWISSDTPRVCYRTGTFYKQKTKDERAKKISEWKCALVKK